MPTVTGTQRAFLATVSSMKTPTFPWPLARPATGPTSGVRGAEVDSCRPGSPAADDATWDGVDEDCDGQVDEDYVSQPTTCGTGACEAAVAAIRQGWMDSPVQLDLPGGRLSIV